MAPSHARAAMRPHVKRRQGKRRPVIELRNHPSGVPTSLDGREGNTDNGVIQPVVVRPRGVIDPEHARTLYVREPGELGSIRCEGLHRIGGGSPVAVIPARVYPRPSFLPFGKTGGLQIRRCQGLAVADCSGTLGALALKPSDFCSIGETPMLQLKPGGPVKCLPGPPGVLDACANNGY
jgi:hypothetical protein